MVFGASGSGIAVLLRAGENNHVDARSSKTKSDEYEERDPGIFFKTLSSHPWSSSAGQ
jgi:hypothetical protein